MNVLDAIAYELGGVPEDENIIDLNWLGECDATADELLGGGKANGDYDDELIIEQSSKFGRSNAVLAEYTIRHTHG